MVKMTIFMDRILTLVDNSIDLRGQFIDLVDKILTFVDNLLTLWTKY